MENIVIFECIIIYDGDVNSIIIVNTLIHVLKIRKVIFVCEAQGRIGRMYTRVGVLIWLVVKVGLI